MGYDVYFYGLALIALAIYGVRYAFVNFHCKKCGSWDSEVRPHFEMNALVPHEFVETRYCCVCDEVIVDVARVEIHEIRNNREETKDDSFSVFKRVGKPGGGGTEDA